MTLDCIQHDSHDSICIQHDSICIQHDSICIQHIGKR